MQTLREMYSECIHVFIKLNGYISTYIAINKQIKQKSKIDTNNACYQEKPIQY